MKVECNYETPHGTGRKQEDGRRRRDTEKELGGEEKNEDEQEGK